MPRLCEQRGEGISSSSAVNRCAAAHTGLFQRISSLFSLSPSFGLSVLHTCTHTVTDMIYQWTEHRPWCIIQCMFDFAPTFNSLQCICHIDLLVEEEAQMQLYCLYPKWCVLQQLSILMKSVIIRAGRDTLNMCSIPLQITGYML